MANPHLFCKHWRILVRDFANVRGMVVHRIIYWNRRGQTMKKGMVGLGINCWRARLPVGLCLVVLGVTIGTQALAAAESGVSGGALAGERYRVLVSTDLGGSDDDDKQSMVHLLLYAEVFDLEGLISSPPHAGRASDIHAVIDIYARDYARLKGHDARYPSPDELHGMTKQGAVDPAPERGWSEPTEGSRWIIARAQAEDPRPLYVLVWGSITDVAQALHDAPEIKDKIRVYFIASWNQRNDEQAFRYIDREHPDVWMIHCDHTFRGWYMGGDQQGDLGNRAFIERHVQGHGALGDFCYPLKNRSIKMGDTPSVAYLLRGDPADPEAEHWGGRFMRHPAGRPNWWVDDPDPAWADAGHAGARTVNRYRADYLEDWRVRLDRLSVEAGVRP